MADCCVIPVEICESGFEVPITLSESVFVDIGFDGVTYPVYPETYKGAYNVVPSMERQVLNTESLTMTGDVVVEKIPEWYGLISWNGSRLRIS